MNVWSLGLNCAPDMAVASRRSGPNGISGLTVASGDLAHVWRSAIHAGADHTRCGAPLRHSGVSAVGQRTTNILRSEFAGLKLQALLFGSGFSFLVEPLAPGDGVLKLTDQRPAPGGQLERSSVQRNAQDLTARQIQAPWCSGL